MNIVKSTEQLRAEWSDAAAAVVHDMARYGRPARNLVARNNHAARLYFAAKRRDEAAARRHSVAMPLRRYVWTS